MYLIIKSVMLVSIKNYYRIYKYQIFQIYYYIQIKIYRMANSYNLNCNNYFTLLISFDVAKRTQRVI
jgi:hypothetical protein